MWEFTENNEDLITVKGMSKKYNGKWVLTDVNKTFVRGVSYAFVGRNGCGKSTMLRILSGITAPTNGQVVYNKKLKYAYVPDSFRAPKMTGIEFLRMLGEMDLIEKKELDHRIEKLAKDFSIERMLDIPMNKLSKGTLQKVLVVQALLKEVDVLFLDEPLSGQDEKSQRVFARKINELRTKGVTVFLSCHERWLTQTISDEVYTVWNSRIVPYNSESVNRVVLVVKPNSKDIPVWDNMIKHGDAYQIVVGENDAQNTIQTLWDSGWKLKGMYGEDSKIS